MSSVATGSAGGNADFGIAFVADKQHFADRKIGQPRKMPNTATPTWLEVCAFCVVDKKADAGTQTESSGTTGPFRRQTIRTSCASRCRLQKSVSTVVCARIASYSLLNFFGSNAILQGFQGSQGFRLERDLPSFKNLTGLIHCTMHNQIFIGIMNRKCFCLADQFDADGYVQRIAFLHPLFGAVQTGRPALLLICVFLGQTIADATTRPKARRRKLLSSPTSSCRREPVVGVPQFAQFAVPRPNRRLTMACAMLVCLLTVSKLLPFSESRLT